MSTDATAPTFTANVLTGTRANGAAKDSAPPPFGSLSAGAMTSATALSGTNATDAKLIHGDRWQELKGNLTENIEDDLTTHIFKNETWTVDEDLKFTVTGKTTDTRVEDVKEYYHAESRFEYFGDHTDLHHEQDHRINPTHTFDILNIEGEYKNVDLAVKATVIEAKGLVLDVTGVKAEAWGAGAEAWGAAVGAGGFKNEAIVLDVGEKALEQELKGMHNKIAALNAQMGAARTIIMPVRIGICIAVHIDSPWDENAAALRYIVHTRHHLRAAMAPGQFQDFDFYLPLLTASGIASATAQQLTTWMGDAEFYLHESADAEELVLLSRGDLDPILRASGMRPLAHAEGKVPWALLYEPTQEPPRA